MRISSDAEASAATGGDSPVYTVTVEPRGTRKQRRAARAAIATGVISLAAAVSMSVGRVVGGATKNVRVCRGVRLLEVDGASGLGGAGFRGNARLVLTCQDDTGRMGPRGRAVELVETRDPFDRAHAVTTIGKDQERRLVPAGAMAWRRSNSGRPCRCAVASPTIAARPRLYPRSAMLASGVAIDSAFDWLHEARKRLADAGIAGFGGGGAGGGGGGGGEEEAVDGRYSVSVDIRLRDLVQKKTRLGRARGCGRGGRGEAW